VSEHQWILGAISTKKIRSSLPNVDEIIDYFLPFACAKCGTKLRLRRSKSMTTFDQPFPEEMRDNKVDVDCDITQVRQIMES